MRQRGSYCVLHRARVVIDMKTKRLCNRILPGQIAVINHPDLDELAAAGIAEAGVQAVINRSLFLTGTYPAKGAHFLFRAGIPLYEWDDTSQCSEVTEDDASISEGDEIAILDHQLYVRKEGEWKAVAPLRHVTEEHINRQQIEAERNSAAVLSQFLDNTLEYAIREKELILQPLPKLPYATCLANRPVVIVARGRSYKEDLTMLSDYIRTTQPVLLAVDGGADALLARGLIPDLIIGDMDSVSDRALRSGAEVVVHAYPSGFAPGEARVKELGVPYLLLPAPGTSEDAAMLLAYEENAEVIVSIGTHSCMLDFLEKGRQGMASTLLVRAKLGAKLIDAKGLSSIYQQRLLALKKQPHKQLDLLHSIYLAVKEWRWKREQCEHRDSSV
ncbi:MAG: putative cytokinetic ring protein SteA [Clostridia bacterium]